MRSLVTVCVLVLSVAAARAAKLPDASLGGAEPVPMAVLTVGQYRGQGVVVLADQSGRRLPIFIGELEASAIEMRWRKQKAPRPLTHDLLDAYDLGAERGQGRVEEIGRAHV